MSATHSRMKKVPEKFGQLKPHSAPQASSITSKKHGKEDRAKLSPNGRVSGALGVQDILSRCQETDCRQVFEIDLNGQGLNHMPNLTEFTKLKIIDLGCNKIKCVSPHDLEKNTNLRELKLYANEISEITGLDCCKELSNLVLQHNKIKSIGKGLQQLRKLRVLRLDSNCLVAIEPREIASCSQLTALDISSNSITDISVLNALPTLQELDVSNNRIQRLADLGRCKKVQELDISRNHLSDLSGLKGLIFLTVLRAEYNQLTSLDSLGKLRQLQELHLSNNRLSHVKSFSGQFPSLEILDISNNAIASVDEMFSLSEISTLLELTTDGNPFDCEDSFGCHRQICQKMPQLEVLNKVSVKRPNTGQIRGPPIMRPISASQVLSARQVEEQIKAAAFEQTSFETSIASRFSIVKDLFESLPVELSSLPDKATMQPAIALSRPATAGEERPASRCSSRSRIAEARAFAAEHFHPKHN